MRTFNQLSLTEQDKAVQVCLSDLIESIVQGIVYFGDSDEVLQANINLIIETCNRDQCPWFIPEMLRMCPVVNDALTGIARCDAEDALYPDAGERVVRIG